jgi:hypothetical protein
VINGVESFRDVKKHHAYILLTIEGFVPVVQTMEEKSLSGMSRTKARLKGEKRLLLYR